MDTRQTLQKIFDPAGPHNGTQKLHGFLRKLLRHVGQTFAESNQAPQHTSLKANSGCAHRGTPVGPVVLGLNERNVAPQVLWGQATRRVVLKAILMSTFNTSSSFSKDTQLTPFQELTATTKACVQGSLHPDANLQGL